MILIIFVYFFLSNDIIELFIIMSIELTNQYLSNIGYSITDYNLTLGLIVKRCIQLKRENKNNIEYFELLDKIRNYFMVNGIQLFSKMDDAQEISANVYLGSVKMAYDLEKLLKYKITHILSIAEEFPTKFNNFTNKNAGLPDILEISKFITKDWLDECYNFINSSKQDNVENKVFIHCQYGKTRSAIVAVYYVSKTENISILEAYEKIKEKRDITIPYEILSQISTYPLTKLISNLLQ